MFQALQNLDVTGLPRENSELAIGSISMDEGQVQVSVNVAPYFNIVSVKATIYVIVADVSDGSVNRYMVTRTASPSVSIAKLDIQIPIQIPQGQSVHRIIAEVVPVMDVGVGQDTVLEANYALTVGSDVLLNE